MGLIRKVTSISTLGLVPFRSKPEQIARDTRRTAKFTKQTRNAVNANTLMNTVQNQAIVENQRRQLDAQRRELQQAWAIAQAQAAQQAALLETQRQALALQQEAAGHWPTPPPLTPRQLGGPG